MATMKGAFVVFGHPVPVPTDLIVFQFNAESLTRKFDPPKDNSTNAGNAKKGGDGANHATQRPAESLTVTIELNAADALAADDPVARTVGLHPTIAQLELLMYPASSLVLLNNGLKLAGAMMIAPEFVPTVLFVWGTSRVLPVLITSVQVAELHFDDRLNPVVAKVDVGLSVLHDPDDLPGPFKVLGMVNHIAKEALSRMGTAQSAFDVDALLPF
jgi:hypothetical protein